MKQRSIVLITVVLFLVPGSVFGVEASGLLVQARQSFSPLPDKPVFAEYNPGTEAKIALGKMLYFDTRLSKSNTISCNSCHNLATAGVDNNPVSTGHMWTSGARNAPTVLNASLHIAQFWDGRAEDVEEQAAMPITNPAEMAATEKLVVERLGSIPMYVSLFRDAFPGEDKPVRLVNVARAIGAFERTLMTPSRFDKFLKGDEGALDENEKTGLATFLSLKCVICHSGVGVGGGAFMKFGLLEKPDFVTDPGLFDVTGNKRDMHVFKVPSLRNVELTYPYFNNGIVWDLSRAVKIMGKAQLGVELTGEQVDSLICFLKSLTGTPLKITIPDLPPSTVSTPKPDIN